MHFEEVLVFLGAAMAYPASLVLTFKSFPHIVKVYEKAKGRELTEPEERQLFRIIKRGFLIIIGGLTVVVVITRPK